MYRKSYEPVDLEGKICLVTGGSRGIGKGIAVQLAFRGATCYVTGRNLETLKNLNEEVKATGGTGKCIPVKCDHANDDEVEQLFQRIDRENDGKLDLLVNNAYSAVAEVVTNKSKFWEKSPDEWDLVNNVGLRNHFRCAIYASRLMIEKRQGLIINISSLGGIRYLFSVPYGVGKCAKDRMAHDCAIELKKYKVAFVSLWPGLVRTETISDLMEMFSNFGGNLETPTYVGRTVAALLSEPHAVVMQKTGTILLTTDIGREHEITDENGKVPDGSFQLNSILRISGYDTLASYIPNFLRVPFALVRMVEAYSR